MSLDEERLEDYPFGKAALKKLGPVPDNFVLFEAESLGPGKGALVIGAQFEQLAPATATKGSLNVIIQGTLKKILVTAEECKACE